MKSKMTPDLKERPHSLTIERQMKADGRFLELEKDRLIEMTWLTGKGGTFGAETVLRIELISQSEGTLLRMTHSGFEDEEAANEHKDNCPLALEDLDQKLISQ